MRTEITVDGDKDQHYVAINVTNEEELEAYIRIVATDIRNIWRKSVRDNGPAEESAESQPENYSG